MEPVYEYVEYDSGEFQPRMAFGRFSEAIFERHAASYGLEGAKKIRSAVTSLLADSLAQHASPLKSNNVLLVGKVQSGKTSNLEALTALAFDNEFNTVVILGGYNDDLLQQCTNRFRRTFGIDPNDIEISDFDTPILFSTSDKDLLRLDSFNDEVFDMCCDAEVPVIITCLKNRTRIDSVSEKLDLVRRKASNPIRALIIDDEGDQASLNTAKDKSDDSSASATYRSICKLKSVIRHTPTGDPLYFTVTATPQANVFLDEYSELRPASIHLLHPGTGYCGAEVFHLDENPVVKVVDEDFAYCLGSNTMPSSLKTALKQFLLSSALLKTTGIKKRDWSDMIIHADRLTTNHRVIYNWVYEYVSELKDILADSVGGMSSAAFALFDNTYRDLFPEEVRLAHPLDNEMIVSLNDVAKHTGVIIQNSKDSGTRDAARFKRNKISIGADLLQRGLTFDHLLTTYFVRWAKTGGNMDTNLQRARWFGYRANYLQYCRLFTTSEIAEEFAFLADMEDDLWSQFQEVEEGTKTIDDIAILARDSRQKPTRRSVAAFRPLSVDTWHKQAMGIFNPEIISSNSQLISNFIDKLSFTEESFGRTDDKTSCLAARCNPREIDGLLSSLDSGIFDERRFNERDLKHALSNCESLTVVRMSCGERRTRSFYPDTKKIKALQQGRNRMDPSQANYLGDKHVVDSSTELTLQVYTIVPKINDEEHPEFQQYMLALYDPSNSPSAFVRS